ncbi:hypothetical protein [Aminobacter niigataensis]|uniref:hypothetical protein n=1 Tax=Aminobacter niigataensis TaxID=83265 RepID=UPI0024C5B9D6|nr:hypothetical protein [Aminobacter niigataensis]CAI2934988.1 conserved protein of unknown function [Aminobacter niigataensis]
MRKSLTPWQIGLGVVAAFLLLRALATYIDWCPPDRCASIIVESYIELLTFAWVSEYQTLLGGLAALIAGAFVLISGREQIRHVREAKKEQRIEDALDSIYAAGVEISEYYRKIKSGSTAPDPLPELSIDILKDISYISPHLAQHYTRVQDYTHTFFEQCSASKNYLLTNRKRAIAHSLCLFQMFRQIPIYAREATDFQPRLNLREFNFDSTPVISAAKEHKLQVTHLGLFKDFFKIDDAKQS